MDLDETISCWKINYGLADKTPQQAAEWWRHAAGGSDIAAPVGAILALAAAIEQIEKLRAELDVARIDLSVSVGHLSRLAAAYGCEDFTAAIRAALAAKEA